MVEQATREWAAAEKIRDPAMLGKLATLAMEIANRVVHPVMKAAGAATTTATRGRADGGADSLVDGKELAGAACSSPDKTEHTAASVESEQPSISRGNEGSTGNDAVARVDDKPAFWVGGKELSPSAGHAFLRKTYATLDGATATISTPFHRSLKGDPPAVDGSKSSRRLPPVLMRVRHMTSDLPAAEMRPGGPPPRLVLSRSRRIIPFTNQENQGKAGTPSDVQYPRGPAAATTSSAGVEAPIVESVSLVLAQSSSPERIPAQRSLRF